MCGLILAAGAVTGFTPAGAASPAGSEGPLLPFTGAPLLLELLIGAGAVLLGLGISRLGRRRAGRRI